MFYGSYCSRLGCSPCIGNSQCSYSSRHHLDPFWLKFVWCSHLFLCKPSLFVSLALWLLSSTLVRSSSQVGKVQIDRGLCVNYNDGNMDLPQTEAGVPAPGIDPTVAELGDLNNVAGVTDWLGTAPPARAALVVALGGGEPRLRDLVYIKGADWDAAIASIRIPGLDGAQATALPPMQAGHMAMLRRIARLRLGLRAVEAASLLPPQVQVLLQLHDSHRRRGAYQSRRSSAAGLRLQAQSLRGTWPLHGRGSGTISSPSSSWTFPFLRTFPWCRAC